jgi:predicted metal-dependent phosphotriesterase family hydrolase
LIVDLNNPQIVRTVLGDVPSSDLGVVSSHEHVIQNHEPVWGDPDSRLCDEDEMATELGLAREAGIGAVVELSTADTNHDLEALARISERSGVHIIGSTGWFYGVHLPSVVRAGPVERLAKMMQHDVEIGTHLSGVRAGVIGEIGWSSMKPEPGEQNVFEAAVLVHLQTGVPIYTHTTDGIGGPEQVDWLVSRGVPAGKIAVSHMDTNPSLAYQLEVAVQGAYLSFDRIGEPKHMDDDTRVELLVALVGAGHASRILLGQDTADLKQLAQRGGRGYGRLLEVFVPMLQRAGINDDDIRCMTVENPANYLPLQGSID